MLKSEPVLVLMLGSLPIWYALLAVIEAFWHPLTQPQREAIIALVTAVSAFIARQQVSPVHD